MGVDGVFFVYVVEVVVLGYGEFVELEEDVVYLVVEGEDFVFGYGWVDSVWGFGVGVWVCEKGG